MVVLALFRKWRGYWEPSALLVAGPGED